MLARRTATSVTRDHRARGDSPVEAIVDAAADDHADVAIVEAYRVEDSHANRIEAIEVEVKKQRFRLERPARCEAPLDASARGSPDRIARWAKAATGRKIALVPISAVASKPKSTDDRPGLRS
jgi:hypothetical protein